MARRISWICISLMLFSIYSSVSTASTISGSNCLSLNKVQKFSGSNYLCKRAGKKLVWVKVPENSDKNDKILSLENVVKNYQLTNSSEYSDSQKCKLSNPFPNTTAYDNKTGDHSLATGFPLMSDLWGKKEIKALGFYVDFTDAQGTADPINEINPVIAKFNSFYSSNSYGNLTFNWKLLPGYQRLPKPAAYYQMNYKSYFADFQTTIMRQVEFIQSSIDSIDSQVDFRNYDIVYIFTPSGANPELIDSIPMGFHTGQVEIHSSDGLVRNTLAITGEGRSKEWTGQDGGKDPSWREMAHETGHILGLVDYYGKVDPAEFVGQWDLMGLGQWNVAPELFSWDRWLEKWLPDSQVACLSNQLNSLVAISAVEKTTKDIKMAVIPLTSNKAIVMESRRNIGFDSGMGLKSTGLLVYVVDSNRQTHMGPIQVLTNYVEKPGTTLWNGNMFKDAPLKQSKFIDYSGFRIQVLESADDGEIVKVSKISG